MSSQFCHLHVHSQYSILESSLSISAIVSSAKEHGASAVALTDHGNMFGAIEFYKAAKEAKITPIVGCELYVTSGSRKEKKKGTDPYHVVLLAKDVKGYKNLCVLSSLGYTEGFYYVPRIDFELLEQHSEGLICLSGCIHGPFGQLIVAKKNAELQARLDQFQKLFGKDLYFELQRHSMSREDLELDGILGEVWLYRQYQEYIDRQQMIEKVLLEESQRRSIPCVATNNCHYLRRTDWRAHEVLLNIQSGEPCQLRQPGQRATPNPKRAVFPSHEFHMKSPEEMRALFSDIPHVCEMTEEIAGKCHLEIDLQTKHYPVFPIPASEMEEHVPREKMAEKYLCKLCWEGVPVRYTEEKLRKVAESYPGQNPEDVVRKRLEYELDIITSKGLTEYFLLVWDFIHWAKNNGIPVGPGRGSGVGSIALYLIGVTDIEPLRFHLFFERFINPGRLSYPDIDVDLCMDRRGEVIDYTTRTYGKQNVAQIITFGTMKAKMSVRDVGRALNIPLSKVNQIAKLIPDDLNITIEKALEKDQELKSLYESDEETGNILQVAKVLQGSIRNTGIHAAGLIVCGEPLIEHIPICTAKDSEMYATQYSMKPVEQAGMLKVDFLGLKTLTSIQHCVDLVKTSQGISLNWSDLPLEDAKTFDLINTGRTIGVFQIEEGGMQELAQQIHMEKFEEIIALLSLYRPGPMEMIPHFIARKWKREPIEYDHPLVEPILQETYGIMVYQEQIMQIAQQLADFTLSEGDILRRAMGKKDAKEMAKQREKFITGSARHGLSEDVASSIFGKMEKFAEYGFNKSHAAAYAYITYVTAYLKAHFPAEWLASLMTCDRDDITKVARFMHEATQCGVACLPPDINDSGVTFVATPQGIRFALAGIKGVGEQAVLAITEERRNGEYTSLYDFVHRIDPKKVGKKVVELLIEAGCFDRFSWHRDESIKALDLMYDEVQQVRKEQQKGIFSLFGDEGGVPKRFASPPKVELRSREQILLRERQLLGVFLSGHPLLSHEQQLRQAGVLPISQAGHIQEEIVFRLAFILETIETKISSKTQKKFAIITISDASNETMEVPIWSDVYDSNHEILHENSMLLGVFVREKRDGSWTTSCRWLAELTDVALGQSHEAYARAKEQLQRRRPDRKKVVREKEPAAPQVVTSIFVDLSRTRASHVAMLSSLFSSNKGKDLLRLVFVRGNQEVASLDVRNIDFSSEVRSFVEELSCWVKTATR
jgi:DNA polymerase-3 subunit alpha